MELVEEQEARLGNLGVLHRVIEARIRPKTRYDKAIGRLDLHRWDKVVVYGPS